MCPCGDAEIPRRGASLAEPATGSARFAGSLRRDRHREQVIHRSDRAPAGYTRECFDTQDALHGLQVRARIVVDSRHDACLAVRRDGDERWIVTRGSTAAFIPEQQPVSYTHL